MLVCIYKIRTVLMIVSFAHYSWIFVESAASMLCNLLGWHEVTLCVVVGSVCEIIKCKIQSNRTIKQQNKSYSLEMNKAHTSITLPCYLYQEF